MTHDFPTGTQDKPKLHFGFLLSGAWIGGLVFCIIFAVASVFLGVWLMDRRMEILEVIIMIVDKYDAQPVAYNYAGYLFQEYDDQCKWSPITVKGQYLVDDSLIARNLLRAGAPGFEVLVPF